MERLGVEIARIRRGVVEGDEERLAQLRTVRDRVRDTGMMHLPTLAEIGIPVPSSRLAPDPVALASPAQLAWPFAAPAMARAQRGGVPAAPQVVDLDYDPVEDRLAVWFTPDRDVTVTFTQLRRWVRLGFDTAHPGRPVVLLAANVVLNRADGTPELLDHLLGPLADRWRQTYATSGVVSEFVDVDLDVMATIAQRWAPYDPRVDTVVLTDEATTAGVWSRVHEWLDRGMQVVCSHAPPLLVGVARAASGPASPDDPEAMLIDNTLVGQLLVDLAPDRRTVTISCDTTPELPVGVRLSSASDAAVDGWAVLHTKHQAVQVDLGAPVTAVGDLHIELVVKPA